MHNNDLAIEKPQRKVINILFLGGAKRVSLAEEFIKAGNNLDYAVSIFSYELTPFVPIAEVGTVVLGKKWADPHLVAHLRSVIHEHDIDVVLPFVDPAIQIAASLKAHLKDVFIPVSSEAIAEIFFNKHLANQWFVEHCIPVPEFKGKLPAIAKPVTGSASKGLVIIESPDVLGEFNSRADRDNFLLQEYVVGDEYTVDCYADSTGRLIAAVPRKRLEVTGGEATKTVTVHHAAVEVLTQKLFVTRSFIGPITVQFIEDKTSGKVYVMEINPRFGGGALCSIHAGMQSPLYVIQEFLGISPQPMKQFNPGTLMVRSFREHYFYANNY